MVVDKEELAPSRGRMPRLDLRCFELATVIKSSVPAGSAASLEQVNSGEPSAPDLEPMLASTSLQVQTHRCNYSC
jgi:hypothetical protein